MIFFLYLILSATLLTGTSPVEAKITDVVQQALLTLTNLCPEGQVKTEEGGCSCPSEKPYRDEQGKCHAVDRDCSEENKVHTKSLGDICRCPEGSVFSGSKEELFGEGECCPNSTPYWDGQKCIVSCEEEGRKQGEEWQKDLNGECCAVMDIRDGYCCPKKLQYEENGKQLCCHAGNVDKGHCCSYDRVWSEYTTGSFLGIGGTTTGHCCPPEAKWNGKTCGDCPDEGVRKKGVCCKNNLAYDSRSASYSTAIPSVCGCPDGGKEKDGYCCQGNKSYSCSDSKSNSDDFVTRLHHCGYYYDAEECGCTLDKKWDKDEKKCVCIEGVPDTEGNCCKGDVSVDENGHRKCCAEDEFARTTGNVTGYGEVTVCCPEKSMGADSEGNCCKNGVSRDENGHQKCCKEGEKWVYILKESENGLFVQVCCPKKSMGADSEGNCCKNGASLDENGYQKCCGEGEKPKYTEKETRHGMSVKVCCPETLFYSVKDEKCCEALDPDRRCCPSSKILVNPDGEKVCGKCPSGERLMTDYDGNYHCCPEGKDFWSVEEYRCCEALDANGKCCPANKVIIGSDAMKICDTCSSEETLFRANDGTSHCCPVGHIWIDE